MHRTRNALLSLGAAIASTKFAHLISDLDVDDVLRPIGLSRRRRHWPENLAFLGAGLVVGGVAALLLAPSSGQQTRAQLAKKADELGEAAIKKVREIGEGIADEATVESPGLGNGHRASASEPI
jgi:YtxH-like protein